MSSKDKMNIKKLVLPPLKWALIGFLIGIASGVVGGLFSLAVSFVTGVRGENRWIVFLLPLGGLLSVFIYKLFRVTGTGTDDAVESAHSEKRVSPRLTPAVFICSVITHLFGGSAGREGAALKMGGGIAALFSKIVKPDEKGRRTMALAGMSGLFAAVFGTPVGAAVFTVEVVRSKSIKLWAVLVSLVSSITAFYVALLLGASPERYHVGEIPGLSLDLLWRVCALCALSGIVSYVFCYAMHHSPRLAKKAIGNDYIRILVLSLAIVALTVVVGCSDYNGGGINVIEGLFEGEQVKYEAFALKILFTALTVAAGFKGGEIVPAFFVGATFGGAAAVVLGLPVPFGAALGMVALFCGATNCPIATLILGTEMFGLGGIGYFVISVILSFLLSGELSLYDGKKFPFKELRAEKPL
ncbi:MAG: chloride channel protein [Clostridia bacterium]|nr:chloride channel protein [Clostridia bacterium]